MALGMALTSPFMQPGTIVITSPSKKKRVVALPSISATSEVAPFRIPVTEPARSKSAAKLATKEAVHFGAGNIGRGFVAEFLYQSGFEVIFVDHNQPIVDKLNNIPSYTVTEIGSEGVHDAEVSNYRAINSRNNEAAVIQEISTANLVTCAVGPNNLKFIAPMIARGIDMRSPLAPPLAVIACENVIGATDKLAEIIISEHTPRHRRPSIHERARFANSAVDRIVPNSDLDEGLDVKIESYCEWVVDKTPFKDHSPPKIGGVKWVNNLQPYIERKLFTVNTGHAAAAYYGHRRGHRYIHEALDDPAIHAEVMKALQETSNLIIHKHNIDRKEQSDYAEKIVSRISNPHLRDSVQRVARSPLRKLSRNERFIGPASQLLERGFKIDALLGAIEQALFFQNVGEDFESFELANILKGLSIEAATEKITGLDKKHPLFIVVEDVVDIVQREGRRLRVL